MECLCCYEDVESGDAVACSPGVGGGRHVPHRFCVVCVRKQIEMDVTRGFEETRCISLGNCAGMFSARTKDRVLTEATRRLDERQQLERAIAESGMQGFWRCPFCDFGAVCEEVEGETTFWCRNPDCQRTSCRRCGGEMHWDSPCAVEEGTVVEAELPRGVVRCPCCSRLVGKDTGCNMVRCTCRVRPTLCVLCGKNITRENHRHYRWTDEDQVIRGMEGCHLYDADNGNNYSSEEEDGEDDDEGYDEDEYEDAYA